MHCGLRDRLFRCAPGSWDMQRCDGCGSGYLDPRPNAATIGLAYSSYYTHTSVIGAEQPPKSAWRRHRIAQRNACLNSTYGYELSPASPRPPCCVSTDRRQRWDKQVGYLRFPGRGARLLDVGCGNGRFLMQMRAAGWEVSGVEPDPASAAQAVAAGLGRAGQQRPALFERAAERIGDELGGARARGRPVILRFAGGPGECRRAGGPDERGMGQRAGERDFLE